MPFKLNGRDYENAPLGRLIPVFNKLSDCPALVKRLGKFREERNFVAHGAIKQCIDPDGESHYSASRKEVARLAKIEKEAIHLTRAIHEEALKFRVQLDFSGLDRDRASARRS